ncbi:saccharopine dehydrogenase NADP-binding domain-containing protein [Tomitella cavernea]|uniref:Trans-acting enoyl reductase family protein n=1 Tax=Tomitella cavernea TaxID=1387982 RepID=A0ABP9CZ77_9ACTN|nr:saccharopine dehydrogenase NADP-binding domain-containing protein [Tomitella cavernea]
MPRIILLGATGYTGSRVLANLAGKQADSGEIILVGRSADRLRAQARCAGLECDTVEADTSVPGALDRILREGDVLVTTVGPFVDLGREVARSAARAGAVYLDSTGEPPFVEWMFRNLGEAAESSGALLVPGFGYDYVPGNLAGWLAAVQAGERTSAIEVGYFMWSYDTVTGARSQPNLAAMMSTATSPGTRASLVKVLGTPSYAYRAAACDRFGLETERTADHLLHFSAAGKERPLITVGGSEHFGLPEVLPSLRSVDVGLGWFGSAAPAIHRMTRLAGPLTTNPIARRAAGMLAAHLPYRNSVPSIPIRITAVARARDRSGAVLAEAAVDGPDPYTLTADLLARGAAHFADGGDRPSGVHGPLTALTPNGLKTLAAECGLTTT